MKTIGNSNSRHWFLRLPPSPYVRQSLPIQDILQVAITLVYRYLPLSDKQGILDTACLCVVLIITLPGITLPGFPSGYGSKPSENERVMSGKLCLCPS